MTHNPRKMVLKAALHRKRLGMVAFLLVYSASVILGFSPASAPSLAQAAEAQSALSACQPFTQVNDNAFGMGTGGDSSYSSEEGFEVLAFNGQLYLGMEADNIYGARIWRTKAGVTIPSAQPDWEEVAADANGKPFGVTNVTQNDHIDSLAEFNGYIYASTANGGSNYLGTRVFRSSTGNPNSWEDAIAAYGAGFGDIYNTNFKDMQVFQGYLCGGTQNWLTGAQVWCTNNGTTWSQKNVSGFGSTVYNNRTTEVWSGYVYNGALYFGVQNLGVSRADNNDDIGKLYRTTNLNGTPTWTEVYSSPPGYQNRVDILGELNGYLYVAARSSAGVIVARSPSGDAGSWTQVSLAGMDGNVNNSGTIVDGAVVYDGGLYLAVSNSVSGFELWRTSGTIQQDGLVDWEKVGSSGLGDSKSIYAELAVFNTYLYAWTSNYTSGQKVLRSSCSQSSPPPPATNTPTPTNTALPTATPTATATQTPLPTSTPTATLTFTPLPTNTPTATATNPPAPTAVPTDTPTNTPLPTATFTNTPQPTATFTNTPLPTATFTNTPQPTATFTNTPLPTATFTNTPEPTATFTNTPLPTATFTNTPLPTATSTNTPLPTATFTHTPEPTATFTNTPEPTATFTHTPEPTATFTNTPQPTATFTNTPEPTATFTNTPEPTATFTNTPEPTATFTNTPLPTATFTNTPLPTATFTNTPLPTATFTNTPEPTATFTHTPQPTATFTNTPLPTATFTNTPEPTATFTNTPEPTATFTYTPQPSATSTPELTATFTDTAEPTATFTSTPEPTATEIATPTPTAAYTSTPFPTATPTPLDPPHPSATPEMTETPMPPVTEEAPAYTPTPSPTPLMTQEPGTEDTPTPTPFVATETPVELTATPTPTSTPQPTETAFVTETPEPTSTLTPTPTPTASSGGFCPQGQQDCQGSSTHLYTYSVFLPMVIHP
ncbi:MAG: hypothetical protein ACOY16_11875 [Chloroflexota bacterium]